MIINSAALAELLDANLAVKVAAEKEIGRIHQLFYSNVNKTFFVAIQDEKSKAIDAILSKADYERLVNKIQHRHLRRAKVLIEGVSPTSRQIARKEERQAHGIPISFKLAGLVKDEHGRLRSTGLGGWPLMPYQNSIAKLLQDETFREQIKNRLFEKLQPGESIAGLTVRVRKDDEEVWISMDVDGTIQIPPELQA